MGFTVGFGAQAGAGLALGAAAAATGVTGDGAVGVTLEAGVVGFDSLIFMCDSIQEGHYARP